MSAPATAEGFESPSLRTTASAGGAAYELKYLVDNGTAARALAWAERELAPDPHGDPALGGGYLTTTLYCDTPELDVYHRSPSYASRKFRVRRYGTMPWVFLERKTKREDRVKKRRVVVPLTEVALLGDADGDETWAGHWFRDQLLTRRLEPSCRIVYVRRAFVGSSSEGPMRLTIDRELRGLPASGWSVECEGPSTSLLDEHHVVELKFMGSLPHAFKRLITDLRLQPAPVSKYRACRREWEFRPGASEVSRA